MSEIESSENETSDIEECVSMAYNKFTEDKFAFELESSENTELSLNMSTPLNGEGDITSPKTSREGDISCRDFSSNCDVDVPAHPAPSQTVHIEKQSSVLKSSKSKYPQLSSNLQTSIDMKSLYLPQLMSTKLTNFKDTPNKSGSETTESRPVSQQSRHQLKKQRRMEREMTKGRGWYNMRVAEMTEEKKNDLMVVQMRKVLDPKRFYKGPDIRGALPKYVQMGTIVETRADFYSSRIPKKNRKTSLVDELLADAEFRRYNKRKYAEIQAAQPQHRRSKAFKQMKRLKAKKK